MKTFTTISALLGITYANPIQHIQYDSAGLRNINQYSSNVMTNKDMHPMSTQIMTQRTSPFMNVVAGMPKPILNPNQYLEKDNFGNYAFGYSTQNSEMAEEGNAQSKKGHFANIMADGKLRRVDYIADNQGFHILRDTADNTGRYIKREAEAEPNVEPTLIQTRMTSYMDSSSLMDDGKDMHRMPNNMMGLDMTSSNMRSRNNQMSSLYRLSDMTNHGMPNMMGRDMSTNMMGRDMSTNMMGQDMTLSSMRARNDQIPSMHRSSEVMTHGMPSNMMGRNIPSNMLGHSMTSNMMGRDLSTSMINRNMDENMIDQTMYTNMMGQGKMTSNMNAKEMPSIIMGQDMSSNLMERNMMGQDMSSNMIERNMMGQDMYSNAMDNKIASSNIMMSRGMNQMTPLNRMSQRMQIETMPSQSLNRFF